MVVKSNNIAIHHSLRGVAALLVVFYHMKDISHDKGASIDLATSFFSRGYIWVDLFFILSGFILSFVYIKSMTYTPHKMEKTKEFLISRFARIYPLHITTLLLLLCINILSHYIFSSNDIFSERMSPESLATNILLVHSWGFHETHTWNIPSWSVSTEVFAYLLFPILLHIFSKRIALSNTVYLTISIAFYIFIFYNYGSIEGGSGTHISRCIAGFLLGMTIFNIYNKLGTGSIILINSMQAICTLGILFSLHFGFHDALIVLLFALLIYFTSDNKGILLPIMSSRPLAYMGSLSYSIYLIHWLVYELYWLYGKFVFSGIASTYSPINVTILKYTIFFLLTIALSFLSYKFIEIPTQRYIKLSYSKHRSKSKSN